MLDATWAVLMMHAATVTSFGAPAWYLLVHVLSLSAVSFYYRRHADTLTVVFVILLIPGIIWGCYARAKLGSPDNATTASGMPFIILIDRSNGYMYTSLHAPSCVVQICLGSAWGHLKSSSCVLLSAACASRWTELAKPERTRCGICLLE